MGEMRFILSTVLVRGENESRTVDSVRACVLLSVKGVRLVVCRCTDSDGRTWRLILDVAHTDNRSTFTLLIPTT